MSKAKFQQLQAENRRCAFLRFLSEQPDYSLNTSMLQTALEAIAHAVSRDVINADAAWLEEQGLVSNEALGSILVVTITQRGLDVAAGRATVPGVQRPGPKG